ncbi:protein-export chaperone SecB [Staphylococcus aureus]|uniref:protein-export chaperone SecB n=1 Tax=Staphylococcus aureus TaxID=1280 RepID=UPI0004B9E875|nr:protein-export chaperone SecB [Staphylococcus aureus]HEA6159840.1 protein-export chaperone SecB [Staphylococcus aureus]
MSSPLKFKNFGIEKMIYTSDCNKTIRNNKLKPNLECNVLRSKDDGNKFNIKLNIEIGDKKFNEYDFFVNVSIIGDFETEENINSDLVPNAIAILFPYLRSLISDLTSKGNKKPIILPPINVNDLLENAEIEEN